MEGDGQWEKVVVKTSRSCKEATRTSMDEDAGTRLYATGHAILNTKPSVVHSIWSWRLAAHTLKLAPRTDQGYKSSGCSELLTSYILRVCQNLSERRLMDISLVLASLQYAKAADTTAYEISI